MNSVTVEVVRFCAFKAAQIITAVFILCLGGLLVHWEITEHGPKIYVFHTSGLIGLISSILVSGVYKTFLISQILLFLR